MSVQPKPPCIQWNSERLPVPCPDCSFESPSGARFCAQCGAKLARHCPQCQAEVADEARFCHSCGRSLEVDSVAAGIGSAVRAPESTPDSSAQAERRQLTVMFCDLANSTALSGRLDPEEFREIILCYQEACTRVIEHFDGYVARYLGDGMLVYFGYPMAHEDDAERAVRAGLGIIDAVGSLDSSMGTARDVELAVRVGISTGPVVVGDIIGEGAAQESAVLGETPNLAARLQGVAQPNSVVIGPGTRQLLSGLFTYEDMGSQALKGISEPVAVSIVLAPKAVESRFDALHQERLTPLVGREEEIALLHRRWNLARDGEGQVALISAEPGIGKSRLCRELREQLTGEPHTTLRYQCSPYHTNSAFYPIINQLERGARFAPTDSASDKFDKLNDLLGQSADDTSAIIPLFATLLSIPAENCYEPLRLTPQQWRDETLAALIGQLWELSARQPVLVVFEDVHWMDPSSRELLDTMVDAIRAHPVLMLLTFRPEFQPPWAGEAHVRLLSLSKLNEWQCASMVARVTGGKSLPTALLEQILDKTDGVPLFVEELTKTILESSLSGTGSDEGVDAANASTLAIPATMQDSLMARLDRLGPAKDVAQVGSVIGREFELELLSAVASMPDAELDTLLAKLVESGLVLRRGTAQRTFFVFKHALIRDAAYESLLKSRRQTLHAKIAVTLSERFADRESIEPELFARHYSEAGMAGEAAVYWIRATEKSLREFANEEGEKHATRGLAELGTLPETDDRDSMELRLQIVLGACLRVSRGFASSETVRAFTRAWTLCERVGNPGQQVVIFRGLFGIAYLAGDLREVLRLGDRAISLSAMNPDLGAYGHMMRGISMLYAGDFVDARRELEQYLSLIDDAPPKPHALSAQLDNEVFGSTHLAITLLNLGFPERALRLGEAAAERARSLDNPLSLAMALNHVVWIRVWTRQSFSSANQDLTRWTNEYGITYWGATAKFWSAEEQSLAGEHESALELVHTAIDEYCADGSYIAWPSLIHRMALMQHRAGDAEGALKSIRNALDYMEKNGERMVEAMLLTLKAEVLLNLSEDNAREAECHLERAITVAGAQGAKPNELIAATLLSRLLHDRRDDSRAREVLAPVYDWFTEGLDLPDLVEAKSLLDKFE